MIFGMGGKPRKQDNRDYNLMHNMASGPIPTVFKPDYSDRPVKMQGIFGTCGGHAGSAMLSLQDAADLSPKYLWKQIKLIDGIPVDQGTDMSFIMKSLYTTGDCHETLCPDVLDSTIEIYSDPSTLTNEMEDDGYNRGILSYAYINNPTIAQIKQAIYTNQAVIALVNCGDGWWTNKDGVDSWNESDILPLRLGNFVDGHFIVLWGYDEQYIYFRNSWGDKWGHLGDGWFDSSYIPNVLEIGTAIDGPSMKQRLISLYTQVVSILTIVVALLKLKQK